MKYNEETDIVQIYYNEVWNDWKVAGIQTPLDLIPLMTSNTTPSGNVFYSSISNPHYGWHAFDGNSSTYWSASAVGNQYIGYNFPSPVCVKSMKIEVNGRVPTSVKLQASNDNTNYIDITGNLSIPATAYATSYFDIDNDDKYSFYRLVCMAGTAVDGYEIRTLQFYGK